MDLCDFNFECKFIANVLICIICLIYIYYYEDVIQILVGYVE